MKLSKMIYGLSKTLYKYGDLDIIDECLGDIVDVKILKFAGKPKYVMLESSIDFKKL